MKTIKISKGYSVKVSDEDYEWLSKYKWYAQDYDKNHIYAVAKRKYDKNISMHRMILGLVDSNILTDHIDHDGLNNQRSNLRIATHSQNMWNTKSLKNSSSKYLGVFKRISDTKRYGTRISYLVYICRDYKSKYLGTFKNEIRAAIAYDKSAIILHGEFANLNILRIRK